MWTCGVKLFWFISYIFGPFICNEKHIFCQSPVRKNIIYTYIYIFAMKIFHINTRQIVTKKRWSDICFTVQCLWFALNLSYSVLIKLWIETCHLPVQPIAEMTSILRHFCFRVRKYLNILYRVVRNGLYTVWNSVTILYFCSYNLWKLTRQTNRHFRVFDCRMFKVAINRKTSPSIRVLWICLIFSWMVISVSC